ncbi:AraC family transcriptional regulator [Mesorhizobium sp. CAU 1741]|uniref:AraC family transcriptional regulator n=1 Tax=Mesorhizobium sp. CAU 1741 TaxID=3140366 RepID=UPI00325ACDC5
MAESWSFEFDNGLGAQEYRAGRAEFRDGPFRGSMEGVELRPGFHLVTVEGISTHPYVLSPEGVTPPGWIVLGSMLGGAGHIAAIGAEEQSWRNQRSFYALTPEMPVAYHIQPNRPWATAGLVVAPEAIDELAGGDPLPGLISRLRGGGRPFCMMRPLKASSMSRLANDLLDPRSGGELAGLRRQARSLEYLAQMLELLADAPHSGSLSARETTRVREARERLLQDLRTPPDLHALAHAVGLSAWRLNEGFRVLYGTTVFDHLRDARLDIARQMLDGGSTMPLKSIAWQVGYAHPTNFINAYRRRFGVSPARDRRERRRTTP